MSLRNAPSNLTLDDYHESDGLSELLTDRQWELLETLSEVGRRYQVGRRPTDDRKVLEAVLWVMRHQARWQDLPSEYPSPRTCQRRLRRWQQTGTWKQIWEIYLDSLTDEARRDWGAAFMNVVLSEARDNRGESVHGARIGRPPFWWPMAREFFRRTWTADQHDGRATLDKFGPQLIDRSKRR